MSDDDTARPPGWYRQSTGVDRFWTGRVWIGGAVPPAATRREADIGTEAERIQRLLLTPVPPMSDARPLFERAVGFILKARA